MKKRILFWSLLSLLVFCTNVMYSDDNEIKTFTDPEGAIEVKAGSDFVIKLDANHTTGYQWKISEAADSSMIELIGHEYISDKAPEGMTGVGGNEYWKFRALKKGTTSVQFIYKRPWEQNDSGNMKKNFAITIK